MLKIIGNDICRSGRKIGYFTDRYIISSDGTKLGYFDNKYVYSMNGRKLAWIEGGYLDTGSGSGSRVPLAKVSKSIVGGVLPLMGNCAIYVLIGA